MVSWIYDTCTINTEVLQQSIKTFKLLHFCCSFIVTVIKYHKEPSTKVNGDGFSR